MAVVSRVKINNNNSQIKHKDQIHVDVDSLEAREEVSKISKKIMQRLITENAKVVEE